MKKSIIAAGASAVALAAMPMVSTFAVANYTDAFTAQLNTACTIARAGHGSEDSWSTASTTDTLAQKTVVNGTDYENFGESTYHVVCNNDNGYTVTVDTTGFDRTSGGSGTANTWAYAKGGYSAMTKTGATSFWTIDTSDTDATLANDIVSYSDASITKDFTVDYSMYVGTSQQVGVYGASAAYTLAPNQ